MDRALGNRQGQLKKHVESIHEKFNSRVNERLENKASNDNGKAMHNYKEYVVRSHKLQQRLQKKREEDIDVHNFKLKEKDNKAKEKEMKIITLNAENEKRRLILDRKLK